MSKRRSATVERTRASTKRPAATAAASAPANAPIADLGTLADALVEGSWLVAALSIPLYFSAVTSTGFEPDKAVLLRALAALAGAGWMVGWMARRGEPRSGSRVDPIVIASIAVFASFGLATLLSVDARLSLFGSLGRGEGFVSYLAYFTFFLVVATRLRTRPQLDRLMTMFIFGSIPAVIYGLIQQVGLDPIPTQGDPSVLVWPSRSTFGQHVFFGSYLVLVAPLTMARALQYWMRRNEPTVRGTGEEGIAAALAVIVMTATFFIFLNIGAHRNAVFAIFPAVLAGYALLGLLFEQLPVTAGVRNVRVWGYLLLLLLQVLVLGLTGARGAWLGFFASVPIFAFLLAWWLRRPRVWWTVLGVSAVFALFVLILNIPGGPLQPLRTVHGLSRLANLTESGEAVSSTKGRMLIWQAVGTLMTKNPAIGNAWSGLGRDLVGYGPDTMHLDFEAVFPLKLRQETFEVWTWDRSHDIYLDYFVQAGILGLLSFLAVVGLFARRVLLALREADAALALPIIGLGAAFGGHLADGIFGIEMPITLMMFWMIVGVAAAWPVLARSTAEVEDARSWSRLLPAIGAYWVPVIVAFALIAAVVSVRDHPTFMALVWFLSILTGVGVVAAALMPRTATARVPARHVPKLGRLGRPALAAIALATVLVLAEQFQFENAAMAELVGVRDIGALQLQQALGVIQGAVHANPSEPFYLRDLGTAYLNLAVQKYQSGDPAYQPKASDIATLSPDTAITLGRDQLYQLTVDSFDKATSMATSDPLFWETEGDAYLRWHHPQPAYAAFSEAERLSLNNPKYLGEEARALLQMGQKTQALAAAGRATALDHSYWYAHASLALVYHALGEKPQARIEAGQALFWEPVFWPPPSQADLNQMRKLQKTG